MKIQSVELIAVSKEKLRNSENEIFYDVSGQKIYIKKSEPIFYYVLRLRDEAHRYAIANHRIKRNKNIFRSEIDNIENIDLKEKNLILYFGSLQEVKKADLKQLQEVLV